MYSYNMSFYLTMGHEEPQTSDAYIRSNRLPEFTKLEVAIIHEVHLDKFSKSNHLFYTLNTHKTVYKQVVIHACIIIYCRLIEIKTYKFLNVIELI